MSIATKNTRIRSALVSFRFKRDQNLAKLKSGFGTRPSARLQELCVRETNDINNIIDFVEEHLAIIDGKAAHENSVVVADGRPVLTVEQSRYVELEHLAVAREREFNQRRRGALGEVARTSAERALDRRLELLAVLGSLPVQKPKSSGQLAYEAWARTRATLNDFMLNWDCLNLVVRNDWEAIATAAKGDDK